MREFLIATAIMCADYHNGQWSKLYRIGCLARQYLRREFQIISPEGWMESNAIDPACQLRAKRLYFALAEKHGN